MHNIPARPVYARWDPRSQAITTRAGYIARHKDCPGAPHALSQTESASPGGPHGSWQVHYEIGGQQLIDYWFRCPPPVDVRPGAQQPRRGQAVPDDPQRYAVALGCTH